MYNKETEHFPLAIARVVPQPEIKHVYKPDVALRQGTLFPDLDKPFMGRGTRGNG